MRRCQSTIWPLIGSRHCTLRSSTLLHCPQRITIRQTSRTRSNARPISSTCTLHDSYTIPVPLPLKQEVISETPLDPVKSVSATTQTSTILRPSFPFATLQNYISKNEILTASKFIHKNQSMKLLRPEELTTLITSLESLELNGLILDLFKTRPQCFTSSTLLHKAMDAAYRQFDYDTFEDIFKKYIQQPDLHAEYFNTALKVFLKTNTEFAKQVLYQMVFSEYPINEDTVFVFLRIANRVATFPTVRFALDLVKNNPKVPVSPKTCGMFVQGFLQGGSARDMAQLSEYLKSHNLEDHSEVRMAYFLNDLKYEALTDVWEKLDMIKQELKEPGQLARLYEAVYFMFYKRMSTQDLTKYLTLLKECGVKETRTVHKRVLDNLARNKMTAGIPHYMKLTKNQHHLPLNKFYITALWRAMITVDQDNALGITNKFRHFITQRKKWFPWTQQALEEIKLDSDWNEPRTQVKRSPLFSQRYQTIMKLAEKEDDRAIISLVNGHLRAGIRPPVAMLTLVLKCLIKMKSTKDTMIYQLVNDLYHRVPVDVHLCMLEKALMGEKSRYAKSKLIREFASQNATQLNVKYYHSLSKMAAELKDMKLSVELLAQARTSPNYRVDLYSLRLFGTAMRSLAGNGASKMMFSLMGHLARDEDFWLNKEFLKRLNWSKKFLMKKIDGSEEEVKAVQKEFEELQDKLVTKYREQQQAAKRAQEETMTLLEEWANETRL